MKGKDFLWAFLILIVIAGAVFAVLTLTNQKDNPNSEADKLKDNWDNNFDVDPLKEDQIPMITIINGSFSNEELSIQKNWRIKFLNQDNVNYTLIIPLIGIEEILIPDSVFEPTFYKEGNISFWLKENINDTQGIITVTTNQN